MVESSESAEAATRLSKERELVIRLEAALLCDKCGVHGSHLWNTAFQENDVDALREFFDFECASAPRPHDHLKLKGCGIGNEEVLP